MAKRLTRLEKTKVKNKDLTLVLTQGTITGADNDTYYIKVTIPGKSILEIYNKKKIKRSGGLFYCKKKT
ncbi:MAG TPA: hypothetical protein VFU29_06480 [Chitinophagaceae bacterium]|nr:hypothetical protein [Chitinophagaceae bacterium]